MTDPVTDESGGLIALGLGLLSHVAAYVVLAATSDVDRFRMQLDAGGCTDTEGQGGECVGESGGGGAFAGAKRRSCTCTCS
ncbi:hypothetical protein [Streptomyces virginiae]|uniref:hypothetical protein n=1 Tax=Streptomyces virginiae TaxID=1961 RepID=UPI0036CDD84D